MKAVTTFTCMAAFALPLLAASSSQPQLVFEPDASGNGFLARTREGAVHLRRSGATFAPRGGRSVTMRLERSAGLRAEPLERQPGVSNYFLGNDPARWRTNVPHYARVRFRDVYPGIDLVYYGNNDQLEYDFIVAPGADPSRIQLAFDGADRVTTERNGDLLITAGAESIRQLRPRVYQQEGAHRREIHGAYKVRTGGAVEFALARYDRSRPLVIDPVIQYSTYIGRGGQDSGVGVAVDPAGNAFITGETTSGELSTSGAMQDLRAGEQDAFVAKLSPQGIVLFITYLGGTKTDTGLAIDVDEAGNAYVCGITASTNFPARNGRSSEPAGGSFDSFVVKLNPTGTQLLYGTYLGGRNLEWASAIAVDSQNGAWVTGWTTSHDFPVQGPYQSSSAGGGEEIFITRLAPSGQSLTYSSFFGGDGRDISTGIAVDDTNAVYVTGATTSNAFPLSNAAQPRSAGEMDAFVFKLIPAQNNLVYSTFLGGTADDMAARVAVDPAGNAFVTGYTRSTNFPVTRGALQVAPGGAADLFAVRVSPNGALDYSTRIGGSGDDWAGGIAADAAGTAYISGWTNSPNFPMRNAPQSAYSAGTGGANQNFDSVVLRLSPNGDELLYSTYFGGRGEDKAYGVALDRTGNVFIAGSTTSPNLPNPQGEFVASGPGVTDVFVARLSADTAVTALGVRPSSLSFQARAGDNTVQPQALTLSSTGVPMTFTTASSAPWLTVRPESGSTPATINVGVDTASLAPGAYTGEVTVRSLTSTLRVGVSLNVTLAPNIVSVTPSPLPRADYDVTIAVSGGGFTASSQVEINGARVATTYVDSRNLRAVVPGSIAYVQGALTVAVVNPDGRSNAVSVPVIASGPTIVSGGVVHGAARTYGAVAPGQIVIVAGAGFGGDTLISASAVDGRLPGALSGTRVLFDNTPAPILWAQSGQIAVVVPYGVAGKPSVQAVVEHNGAQSAPVTLAVAPSVPGLFTADNSGSGQAAAQNENGAYNSASVPASKGSLLVLYATGEGQLSPLAADGQIISAGASSRPVLPVSVTIAGLPAEVVYAGSSAGSVAGLLQINVRVPAGAPSGDAVPVLLTVGNVTSPAGVTVAIE